MSGATDTTIKPEDAPTGIVTVIAEALHELTVTGVAFSNTTLLPWAEPKFDPLIATRLPTEPVVADTLVMIGAGEFVELTDTLSKVAVAKLAMLSLLTANPMYAFVAIVIVWVFPTWIQFTPSEDAYPLKLFPLLTTIIQ